MTTINGQLKDICEAHGISLHCSANKDGVTWHAVQIREAISGEMYKYDIRSASKHSTIEATIDGVFNAEWELAK